MFFFNDTATTEIYTLSLHDALPIWIFLDERRKTLQAGISALQLGIAQAPEVEAALRTLQGRRDALQRSLDEDRKSTRLNSKSRQYLVCRLLLEKNTQYE